MGDQDLPEFDAATLPPPLGWRGNFIWRRDLSVMQYSTGAAWVTPSYQDPTTGALVGVGTVFPSGDATGVTDAAALQAVIDAGIPLQTIPGETYILDRAISLINGSRIEFGVGSVLKLADSFTKECTVTSGSAIVQVPDTERLRVGMYALDNAVNLQAGDAFGCTPFDTKIQSIDSATQVTLTQNCTASGAKTLRFYVNTNCINAINVSDWSLVCRGGWAKLDANGDNAYPYFPVDDSVGNGLRIVSGKRFLVDGIWADSARYHGCIGVGECQEFEFARWKGTNNGFRGLHMHSEGIVGNTTPELRDCVYGLITLEGNGRRAWELVRETNVYNSGLFAVFEGVYNTQMGIIRCKNEYGNGLHFTGAAAGAFEPNFRSKFVAASNVLLENCGVGLFLTGHISNVNIPSLIVRGKPVYIASGVATLAAASSLSYFVAAGGTLKSYKVKAVQLPAGTIAANNLRGGMRCVMSNGSTGMASSGSFVLNVQIGAGAGGTDLAWVFNESDPVGTDAYTTANTGLYAYFYPCRDYGIYHSESDALGQKAIKFGQVLIENGGRWAWATNYSASQIRYSDISCDSLTVIGGSLGLVLSSVAGLTIGKLHQENVGNLVVHVGGASGSYNSILQNCADFTIRTMTSAHNIVATNDNEAIRCDADCRNGTIEPISLRKPSSGDTINILTTSGAGANASGKSGPITLINPTASDGTALTVAGSHITRTAASACIVTRPVDAP